MPQPYALAQPNPDRRVVLVDVNGSPRIPATDKVYVSLDGVLQWAILPRSATSTSATSIDDANLPIAGTVLTARWSTHGSPNQLMIIVDSLRT